MSTERRFRVFATGKRKTRFSHSAAWSVYLLSNICCRLLLMTVVLLIWFVCVPRCSQPPFRDSHLHRAPGEHIWLKTKAYNGRVVLAWLAEICSTRCSEKRTVHGCEVALHTLEPDFAALTCCVLLGCRWCSTSVYEFFLNVPTATCPCISVSFGQRST